MRSGSVGVFGSLLSVTVVALGLSGRCQAQTQVKAKNVEAPAFPTGNWYSSIELRHHINTYYDKDGYLRRRDPSMHARLQVGALFYEGLVDAYATLGAYKVPETQQVLERRPELAIDVYPYKSPYLTLLQYNLVQLPYQNRDAKVDEDLEDHGVDTADGSVYTFGFAPTVKYPFMLGNSGLRLKSGFDIWTRFYSRKQYTKNYHGGDADEEDDGHFELGDSTDPNAEVDPTATPIEDYAMHYQSQFMGGVAFQPGFLPALNAEVTVNHISSFDPQYTRLDDGRTTYKYGADRYSYYRLRLEYQINDRVALVNDFYHFHKGFFAAERTGDERRFRNIARLTCRL